MSDIERLGAGNPDGAIAAYLVTDKLGFYGTVPVGLQKIGTVATTAPTSTSPYGFTSAQAQSILNATIALQTLGLLGSV